MRPAVNVKWSIALVVAVWSGPAAASTSFPAAVDQTLMLSAADTVESKFQPTGMGCLLCHMTPAGGNGTNNTFGSALKRAGAVGGNPNTVGPALDQLESQTPRAIDDIRMGIDPNDDPESLQGLPPQPLHGCSVGAPAVRHEEAWCASFVALALLAWSRLGGRSASARR
jgi:hypothetical protein